MTKYLAIASRASARHGFADMAELAGRIRGRLDVDAQAWLLHLRGAGRSMAIPAGDSALAGVDLAVCFSREASFPEPTSGGGRVDPLTVVHELLHLFGATDKYGVPLADFPGDTVTRDDIMRMDHETLDRLRVDDRTASEIGWGDLARAPRRKKPAGDRKGRRRVGRRDSEGVDPRGAQFASIDEPPLAIVFAMLAASEARRASPYLARGAEADPSP